MTLELDLKKLSRNNLKPNQYVILAILYHKDWELAKRLFSLTEAIMIRDSLIDTKFILDKSGNKKFSETVISRSNVGKLLGVRSDKIDFLEFFNEYPMKVGSRILRPKSSDTIEGKRLEQKYLKKIKTQEDHKDAIDAVKAYVRRQRIAGKLQFLNKLEVVINNAKWESWDVFIVRYDADKPADHIDSI